MTLLDHARERLAAMAILVVPLVAVLATPTSPAAAQYGPDPNTPPYISVTRLSCPDDVAVGDELDQRCEPVQGEDVAIDGAATVTQTTTETGYVSFSDLDADETYTVTAAGIGPDRATLITCNPSLGETSLGYGGARGLPVTLGTPGSFTIELAPRDDGNGQGANCHWFDLPAAALGDEPAGLIVFDAAVASSGASAPGPVGRDLVLSGDALDEPLAIDTTNPEGVPAGPIVTGPILVPAGDYTLEDRATGFTVELTIAPGQILTPDVTAEPGSSSDSTPAPRTGGATFSFPGTNLDGTWTDLDTDLYGDEAGALYGADSGFATGTLTFDAPAPDATTGATLTLLGLDDELPAPARIAVSVNGTELHRGDSTFPAWNPDATGNQWGDLTLDIDPDLLRDTDNELTITNLSPGSETGTPPWVMITRVTFAQ